MTRASLLSVAVLGLLCLCSAAPTVHAQIIYNVSINTTGLNNTAGGLAFDLIAGDNVTPNNTITISNFATNGTMTGGSNTNQGTASGNLPALLTLRDSAFTESFRSVTFGTSLSFTLSSTNNFAAPGAPDEFSFFLTNAVNTGTVVTTSDPTGADALFILDLNGMANGALTVFTPRTAGVSYTVTPAQQSVPEPSSLATVAVGLLVGGIATRSHRRRR